MLKYLEFAENMQETRQLRWGGFFTWNRAKSMQKRPLTEIIYVRVRFRHIISCLKVRERRRKGDLLVSTAPPAYSAFSEEKFMPFRWLMGEREEKRGILRRGLFYGHPSLHLSLPLPGFRSVPSSDAVGSFRVSGSLSPRERERAPHSHRWWLTQHHASGSKQAGVKPPPVKMGRARFY